MAAIRFERKKSLAWIISLEGLGVGLVAGGFAASKGLEGAPVFAVGLGTAICFALLVVYITAVFWSWTLLLSGAAGVGTHRFLMGADAENGWAVLVGLGVAAAIIGLHADARRHFKAENTRNVVEQIVR